MVKYLSLIAVLMVLGCSGPQNLAKCVSTKPDTVCAVCNPEDMVSDSSGDWLFFSEQGREDENGNHRYGRISVLNTSNNQHHVVFDHETPETDIDSKKRMGDKNCPGFPDVSKFFPHGIDLRTLDNGRTVLAVLNHGGREAIELFEVDESGAAPSIEWCGCVQLDDDLFYNDVTLLDDGSMYFTHFISNPHKYFRLKVLLDAMCVKFGGNTGQVFYWSEKTGITSLENSHGIAPNGIISSKDGKTLFVCEWGASKLYRLKLDGETVIRDEIELDVTPDNLTWTKDGSLLVTGQHGDPLYNIKCVYLEPATCNIRYSIYKVDPENLSIQKVASGIGAASVAVHTNSQLYIGTFAGDNIQIKPCQ